MTQARSFVPIATLCIALVAPGARADICIPPVCVGPPVDFPVLPSVPIGLTPPPYTRLAIG